METFVLTPEQVEFYHENGYVHVKGMFSPEEAANYRREVHELADRLKQHHDIDATWASAREVAETLDGNGMGGGMGSAMGGSMGNAMSGGMGAANGDGAANGMGGGMGNGAMNGAANGAAKKTELLHCHDVQFYSAAFSRLIVDERLTGAAADVMGTPNVQLHHTKMFIKPPEKGSPFPMHQDCPFFPHDNHSMIAAIIHFDDAPLEKGCVRVMPGSHKLGLLEHEAEGSFHLPFDEYPIEDATPLPAKAGDVLIFSYLTIHGSGINESDEARTTVLVQMRDPADPPTIRVHESRGQGMMLRGIDPLKLAKTATVGAM